jgi:hypothetical protein
VVYSSNLYAMKWLSRKYAAQGEVRGAQHMNFMKVLNGRFRDALDG